MYGLMKSHLHLYYHIFFAFVHTVEFFRGELKMKNCVLKNKHSSVRGSLTLEAAMIMPVIVFVQVLCIYMSVYVYNSLLISQVSYLACLRAVQTKEENNEVLAAEAEREIANLLQDELIFMKDLQWDGDKIQRILTRLGNRYAQHSIYHLRGMGDLENELIRIRSVAHDDTADALQGAVQLLTFAPTAQKPKENFDMFNFLRKQTPTYRERNNRPYKFGENNRQSAFVVKQGL